MNKNKRSLDVAIYIRYDVDASENWLKKELFLNEYCKKKGYNVVQTFRDVEMQCEYYSNTVLDIMCTKELEFNRLIALDVNEFAEGKFQISSLHCILLDKDVRIETVKDGLLGEDLLFGVTIHKNVTNNEELKKLQSINFEERPF